MKNNNFDLRNNYFKIGGVEIIGNAKTKNHVFEHFLKGVEENTNMKDLMNHLKKVRNGLMGLSLFSDVHFHLEPTAFDNLIQLMTVVKESKQNKSFITSSIGNQSQSAVKFFFHSKSYPKNWFQKSFFYLMSNVFGGAEKLIFSTGLSKYKFGFFGTLELPIFRGLDATHPSYGVSLSYNNADHSRLSDYTENIHSLKFFYNHYRNSYFLNVDSRLINAYPNAHQKLIYQSGWNSKISLKHTYLLDKRDDSHLPTTGFAFKFSNVRNFLFSKLGEK